MLIRGLTFDDVLLMPNYGNNSRDDGSVEVDLGRYHFDIPIISANMDTITGEDMAISMACLGGLGILHRFMSIEDNVNMFKYADTYTHKCEVGVSIGVGEDEKVRAEKLYEAGARLFCVDVAHAHNKHVGKMVKYLKSCEDTFVIAGNVATYGGADYLVGAGADVVKVGVGAGSVCITRRVTGFGVPQLTATMDCARIARPIIVDGGMRMAGDIVKALAAGASMVMLGRMLAGTQEAIGGIKYRGMASREAREDSGKDAFGWRAAEGISIEVEQKGPVKNVIEEIVGGIKSGLSYAGAKNLDELRRKACFIEVSQASAVEGAHYDSIE